MTLVTQDMTQTPIPVVGDLHPVDVAAPRGVIVAVLLSVPLWAGVAGVLSAVL